MEEDNKTKTEETNQSKKDITNKWLDLIYTHLTNLDSLERRARDGCKDIIEYVNIPRNQLQSLPDIQIKNLSLLISEFEMTFKDVEEVVNPKSFKNMLGKFNEIIKIKVNGFKGILCYTNETNINSRYKPIRKNKKKLTSTFYLLINKLSELRGDLVTSLKHILWIKDDGENKLENQGEY